MQKPHSSLCALSDTMSRCTWLSLQGTLGYSSRSTWQNAKALAAPIVRKPVPGIRSFSPAPPVAQKTQNRWNCLCDAYSWHPMKWKLIWWYFFKCTIYYFLLFIWYHETWNMFKWTTCYEGVGTVAVIPHQGEESFPGHKSAEEECLDYLET